VHEHGLKTKQQVETILKGSRSQMTQNPDSLAVEKNLNPAFGERACAWINTSLRKIGRYGFILLGLPNIAGFAVVALLAGMVVRLVPRRNRRVLFAVAEALSGFATVFTTVSLARLARIETLSWMFALSWAWFFFYFVFKNRFAEFFRSAVGLFCGLLTWRMITGQA